MLEKYVLNYANKLKRSLIAQFRSGTFPLQIEIGRHRNINVNDRLCCICNLNAVEDEFHVIRICPEYDTIRQKMYEAISIKQYAFNDKTNEEKFKDVMKFYQNELANFLVVFSEIRSSNMYN